MNSFRLYCCPLDDDIFLIDYFKVTLKLLSYYSVQYVNCWIGGLFILWLFISLVSFILVTAPVQNEINQSQATNMSWLIIKYKAFVGVWFVFSPWTISLAAGVFCGFWTLDDSCVSILTFVGHFILFACFNLSPLSLFAVVWLEKKMLLHYAVYGKYRQTVCQCLCSSAQKFEEFEEDKKNSL